MSVELHINTNTDPPLPRVGLTPGRCVLLLLVVEALLFLSNWLTLPAWHTGYAVLTCAAAVGVAMVLLGLWWVVAAVFRWKFQVGHLDAARVGRGGCCAVQLDGDSLRRMGHPNKSATCYTKKSLKTPLETAIHDVADLFRRSILPLVVLVAESISLRPVYNSDSTRQQ